MHRAGSAALSHFPRDPGYLCASYEATSRPVSMQGDLAVSVKTTLGNIAKGPLSLALAPETASLPHGIQHSRRLGGGKAPQSPLVIADK